MSSNPYVYQPPSDEIETPAVAIDDELAERSTRLAAVIFDCLLSMAILMPIMYATGFFDHVLARQVGVFEQVAMSFLSLAVMLVLNGYLLVTRGQSIGKLLTKIQVVDVRSGELLPFLRIYVCRYLWILPIVVVAAFLPDTVEHRLVNTVGLVDALMIFGAGRRCLHDYLAGSKVVLYQANRPRAS